LTYVASINASLPNVRVQPPRINRASEHAKPPGAKIKRRPAEQATEKRPFVRHSERSEESLFDLNASKERKEGFLASLGMTMSLLFFGTCEASPTKFLKRI
jgi:hypothetical protein